MFRRLGRSTAPLLVVLASVVLTLSACGGTDAASVVASSGPAVEASVAAEASPEAVPSEAVSTEAASPEAMSSDSATAVAAVTDSTYGYQAWMGLDGITVNVYVTNTTADPVTLETFAFDVSSLSATLEDGSTVKGGAVSCLDKEIAPGDYATCFMSGFDVPGADNPPVFVTVGFLSPVDGTPLSVPVTNDPGSAPEWR